MDATAAPEGRSISSPRLTSWEQGQQKNRKPRRGGITLRRSRFHPEIYAAPPGLVMLMLVLYPHLTMWATDRAPLRGCGSIHCPPYVDLTLICLLFLAVRHKAMLPAPTLPRLNPLSTQPFPFGRPVRQSSCSVCRWLLQVFQSCRFMFQ